MAGRTNPVLNLCLKLDATIDGVMNGTISATDAQSIAAAARQQINLFQLINKIGPQEISPIVDLLSGAAVAAIQQQPAPEVLREKIVQLLSEEGQMKVPALAARLRTPAPIIEKTLNHEWFEKTKQGYRMAESC